MPFYRLKPAKAAVRGFTRGYLKCVTGCCLLLREKPLQAVAPDNQLASIPYNEVLMLKTAEIFGYPRTRRPRQISQVFMRR